MMIAAIQIGGYRALRGYWGLPPDAKRCLWGQAQSRQCKNWRWGEHEKFCRYHARRGKGRNANDVVRNGRLPRFYSKVLTQTLNAAIDRDLALDPSEQVSLSEELALTRQVAAHTIELWAGVIQTQPIVIPSDVDDATKMMLQIAEQQRRDALISAQLSMEMSLDRVKSFAEAAARIYAGIKDKCNIHTMQTIVNQIVRLMYEVCDEQGEQGLRAAERFETLVRDRIRLPELISAEGTTITADQAVLLMDSTIPLQ